MGYGGTYGSAYGTGEVGLSVLSVSRSETSAALTGEAPTSLTVSVVCPGATVGPVERSSAAWSCELSGLAWAAYTATVSDGVGSVQASIPPPPAVTHTLRAELGPGSALAALAPGADLTVAAGEGAVTAPALSAAPALATMAARGGLEIGSVSALVAFGPCAGVGAVTAPEILSPDTGHRIRAVAGASQAVVNLVPGADVVTAPAAGGMGAVALSAEVPTGSAAAIGLMSEPLIALALPSLAGAGAVVAPSLSGAPALPVMAGRGLMRPVLIQNGSPQAAPPRRPVPPWWGRSARGGRLWRW